VCGNCTLRVVITIVRVEIKLMRVVNRPCLSNLHCMCKLNSACRNHTVRMESHSACINHTRACRYHTRECLINTHPCQNYTRVCGNCTLRVEITIVRVEIKLMLHFHFQFWYHSFILVSIQGKWSVLYFSVSLAMQNLCFYNEHISFVHLFT
jgi:hypothetical protein